MLHSVFIEYRYEVEINKNKNSLDLSQRLCDTFHTKIFRQNLGNWGPFRQNTPEDKSFAMFSLTNNLPIQHHQCRALQEEATRPTHHGQESCCC